MLFDSQYSYKEFFHYFEEVLSVNYGNRILASQYVEEEDEKLINLNTFYKHVQHIILPPLFIYNVLRETHMGSSRITNRKEYFNNKCYHVISQLKATLPKSYLLKFDDEVKANWKELEFVYRFATQERFRELLKTNKLNVSRYRFGCINWNKMDEWVSSSLENIYDIGGLENLLCLSRAYLFMEFRFLAEEINQLQEYLNVRIIHYDIKKGFNCFLDDLLKSVVPEEKRVQTGNIKVLEGHFKYSRTNPNYLFNYLNELNDIFKITNLKFCKQKVFCAICLIIYKSKVITNCATFKQCVSLLCEYYGRIEPKDCRPNKYEAEALSLKNRYFNLEHVPLA